MQWHCILAMIDRGKPCLCWKFLKNTAGMKNSPKQAAFPRGGCYETHLQGKSYRRCWAEQLVAQVVWSSYKVLWNFRNLCKLWTTAWNLRNILSDMASGGKIGEKIWRNNKLENEYKTRPTIIRGHPPELHNRRGLAIKDSKFPYLILTLLSPGFQSSSP